SATSTTPNSAPSSKEPRAMRHVTRPTHALARRGFTLVELIVVLAIMLILVSLSVSAVMKMIAYQQNRNTEQSIVKLDQAFQKQWRAVIDTAKTEQPNPIAQFFSNGDDRRARVLHVLMSLRREFPTTFAEAA